jgi:hypothetical protein
MANVFSGRPYSYTEGAAMMGFGRSMMQMAGTMAQIGLEEQEEEQDLQYKNDIAHADALDISTWGTVKLEEFTKFQGEPDKLVEHLEKNIFPSWEKNLLLEGKTEKSRTYINNKWLADRERYKAYAAKWASDQKKTNRDVEYDAFREAQKKSKVWLGVDDLADSLFYADYTINNAEADQVSRTGKGDFQTDKVDIYKYQIKDYLLQSGDENYINNPNLFIEQNGLNIPESERELFGSEDIINLKKEYHNRKLIDEYEVRAAREKKESEVLMSAFDFAEKGDFGSGIEEIKNAREDLGAESYIDALNKYQNAFRILNDTGVNVYKDTQNWKLYWEDLQRAIDKDITEKELRDHVGEDGYSVTHFKEIKSVLEGTSSKVKAFEDSAAAKNLEEQIDSMIPKREADRYDVALNQYAMGLGMGLLKDAITDEMTEQDKKDEAIRIGWELERQLNSGELGSQFEAKFDPTKKPAIQPEGKAAGYVMGKKWGTHDGKGNVILTLEGIRKLYVMFNGDKEKIREYARKKGYIIPKQ